MQVSRAALVLLLMQPAYAEQSQAEADMAFFEFLAELEKIDGQWVDPMQLPPVETTKQETQNDE